MAIGFFEPDLLHFSQYFFYLIVFLLPLFILVRIFYDWSINERTFTGSIFHYLVPIPPGLIFSTDLKRNSFPRITAIIIIINGIIYAFASREIVNLFAFPPHGDPSYIHILISVFTSAFLHANFTHLAGNMIFLWVFGSTLEPRIGSLRYFLLYFLCIIASNIIVISLLIFQYVKLDSIYAINNFHSIGASGAIAGIMGIFDDAHPTLRTGWCRDVSAAAKLSARLASRPARCDRVRALRISRRPSSAPDDSSRSRMGTVDSSRLAMLRAKRAVSPFRTGGRRARFANAGAAHSDFDHHVYAADGLHRVCPVAYASVPLVAVSGGNRSRRDHLCRAVGPDVLPLGRQRSRGAGVASVHREFVVACVEGDDGLPHDLRHANAELLRRALVGTVAVL